MTTCGPVAASTISPVITVCAKVEAKPATWLAAILIYVHSSAAQLSGLPNSRRTVSSCVTLTVSNLPMSIMRMSRVAAQRPSCSCAARAPMSDLGQKRTVTNVRDGPVRDVHYHTTNIFDIG